MARTGYDRGAKLERDVVKALVDNGYWATRTPGSKGKRKVDVFAIKPMEPLFIQCKYGDDPSVSPAERAILVNLARMVHGEAITATRKPGKHIVYRRLIGYGAGEWEPWTPDALGASQNTSADGTIVRHP